MSFKVSDGAADSNVLTRNIAVTPVNDAPVLAGIEAAALGLHGERPGHGDHGDDHRQRRGQREPGRGHGPDHGNYQNGQDVLSFADTGHDHGKLERGHRDADLERQRHGGQLPGGVAGGEVPEHQRQSQRLRRAR